MGWAVQRADGSYRAWCRAAPDEPLQPDETYVELPAPPKIGPPTGGPAQARPKAPPRRTPAKPVNLPRAPKVRLGR